MLVLGPTTASKLPVLNKDGIEVHVNRLKVTEVKRDVVKRAESVYASFVKSENILIEAYPNDQLKEEFPKPNPTKIPGTMREYQAETNRLETHSSEFLKFPNITVNAEAITFTEYSKLGELPFSDKTYALTRAMAYLLVTLGSAMQLIKCRKEAL